MNKEKYSLKPIIVIGLGLLVLSYLAGIGTAVIFFNEITVHHELEFAAPDSTFEEYFCRYFTGKSRDEIIQSLDEAKREIAKKNGYSSYEEYLKAKEDE